VLFGVQNPDDQATNLSATQLVGPLGSSLPPLVGTKDGRPLMRGELSGRITIAS
jgi:hypothetical protein